MAGCERSTDAPCVTNDQHKLKNNDNKQEVITSALALEGFKFIWLLEKQVPDPTLYEDDDGDMTTRDKHSLQKKKEEI